MSDSRSSRQHAVFVGEKESGLNRLIRGSRERSLSGLARGRWDHGAKKSMRRKNADDSNVDVLASGGGLNAYKYRRRSKASNSATSSGVM